MEKNELDVQKTVSFIKAQIEGHMLNWKIEIKILILRKLPFGQINITILYNIVFLKYSTVSLKLCIWNQPVVIFSVVL